MGRPVARLSSKIVGVCDAYGRLVDFVLVPGQAHKLADSQMLTACRRRLPGRWQTRPARAAAILLSKAIDAVPVVPSRRNARQKQPCPGLIYRHRNLIERC